MKKTYAPLCCEETWFDMSEILWEFVDYIRGLPDVDATRICLMGISQPRWPWDIV